MLTISLISAVLGLFGKKARFIVTPKTTEKMTFWNALKFQWKEFVFSTILIVLAIIFTKTILPIILISATGYLSIFLLFFSNKTYDENQVKKIDEKTSSISLRINKTFEYTKAHEADNK